MTLDAGILCRIQFALTAAFHFLFPPISIGLAWLLVFVEWRAWKKRDPVAESAARFFGKLLGLTFAVGVATGIPMEFQFGTNWSRYSKFVGDIFGAPLAAEGVFAFFLESGFLGLYLFGRQRVARKWLFLAIVLVAVGSTMSAFFILAANSWMQTPAGFVIRNGRAELTSISAAVFNPSMWPRFFHTFCACLVAGAFFMAGISAAVLLRDRTNPVVRYTLKCAIIMGILVSILEAFPFGHMHAKQVAHTLLTGGGALFAAFPAVYATVFSGFYLALMVVLACLIFRGVAMEFRGKVNHAGWRGLWDRVFGVTSALLAVLFGVAFGNVVRGVEITADGTCVSSFLSLLNPFALIIGVLSLAVLTMHAAVYLCNKDTGSRKFLSTAVLVSWVVAVALFFAAWAAGTFFAHLPLTDVLRTPAGIVLVLLYAVSTAAVPTLAVMGRFSQAFVASSAMVASMLGLAAAGLFPRLLPSLNDPSRSLTIYNSSSSHLTLVTMLVIALIGMPCVIAYTAAIHFVFRGKVVIHSDSY